MKVVFATPTLTRPCPEYLASLEASLPLITAAGWTEGYVAEIGCPYISAARSKMLSKALADGADVVVFIDHDLSWAPRDLLTLLQTPGDVVAGTYRFKKDPEEYMGALVTDGDGYPLVRGDGCVAAHCIPAGFLKVTRRAVEQFMTAYPELVYGPEADPSVDLFNHGAHDGIWYGEDYAFSRNWRALGGDIWLVPNLALTHHTSTTAYPGNFHEFLLRQPGGREAA